MRVHNTAIHHCMLAYYKSYSYCAFCWTMGSNSLWSRIAFESLKIHASFTRLSLLKTKILKLRDNSMKLHLTKWPPRIHTSFTSPIVIRYKMCQNYSEVTFFTCNFTELSISFEIFVFRSESQVNVAWFFKDSNAIRLHKEFDPIVQHRAQYEYDL